MIFSLYDLFCLRCYITKVVSIIPYIHNDHHLRGQSRSVMYDPAFHSTYMQIELWRDEEQQRTKMQMNGEASTNH